MENTTKRTQKLFIGAEVLNAYRVIPRLSLASVLWLSWISYEWFMTLDAPTTAQAIVITSIAGLLSAVIGLYNKSGDSSSQRLERLVKQDIHDAKEYQEKTPVHVKEYKEFSQ